MNLPIAISLAALITMSIWGIREIIIPLFSNPNKLLPEFMVKMMVEDGFDASKIHYLKKEKKIYMLLGKAGLLSVTFEFQKKGLNLALQCGVLTPDAKTEQERKRIIRANKDLHELSQKLMAVLEGQEADPFRAVAIVAAECVKFNKKYADTPRQFPKELI